VSALQKFTPLSPVMHVADHADDVKIIS